MGISYLARALLWYLKTYHVKQLCPYLGIGYIMIWWKADRHYISESRTTF